MAESMPDQRQGVTVREFAEAPESGLNLEILQGDEGMSNWIRSPRIQKLGLALAGFAGYLHPHRIQILGGSEINYLQILEPAARDAALERLPGTASAASRSLAGWRSRGTFCGLPAKTKSRYCEVLR